MYFSHTFLLIHQIGDFGMSRNLAKDIYYQSHGGKIPIRWTAPEVGHGGFAADIGKNQTEKEVISWVLDNFELISITTLSLFLRSISFYVHLFQSCLVVQLLQAACYGSATVKLKKNLS